MSEQFSFPEALLNQIEECSNGGFVLLYLDSDRDIEAALSYDSESILRALVSKGGSWSKGMTKLLDKEDMKKLEDFYDDEQQTD